MSLMRNAILMASASTWMRKNASRYSVLRRSVTRFMPGEKVEDALAAARQLADRRIATVLTHLGENIKDPAEAESVTQHYLDVLKQIAAANLPTEVSVKLTQLGLDLDREICFSNLARLIAATPPKKTLWIDMEQSPYIDATLEIYRRVRSSFPNVGVCVQAYLYRTQKDVGSLISIGAAVRLVKGAYNEPAEIAYPRRQDVNASYLNLAKCLLGPDARNAGVRAAIATHDRNLIAKLIEWAEANGVPKERLEFQMLYGIQRAEQVRLAQEGYRSAVLISYGAFWYPWFMRRLAERPANVLFLAKNFFGS